MQLAGDAQNVIAMTDDEKKRLDDLLSDINCLPDIQEEEASRPVCRTQCENRK